MHVINRKNRLEIQMNRIYTPIKSNKAKQISLTNIINRQRSSGFLFCLLMLALLPVTLLTGCNREKEAYTKTDFCFDTVVSVTVYETADNGDKAEKVLAEAISLCYKYDDLLSRTKEGSDIYRINHAGGEWTAVSEETARLIYTALNYCDMTGGAIDISVSPVNDLWKFNSDGGSMVIPSDTQLDIALSHVDYSGIEINGNKVRLSDPEAAIDLGFIAKGYVADRIKAYLLSEKIDHALINLGGNILTLGTRPDENPFKIGIQEPFADAGVYLTTVEACDGSDDHYASVVTSGIYERCFTLNDTLYHHILNTRTGYPVKTDLNSVTILTDSSTQADALSTTCLVLGLEEGKALIESLDGAEAIFITSDNKIVDTRKE